MRGGVVRSVGLALLLCVGFGRCADPGAPGPQWRTAEDRFQSGDFEGAAVAFRGVALAQDGSWATAGLLNAARADGAAAQRFLAEGPDWLLQPARTAVDRAQEDVRELLAAGVEDAPVRETWSRLGELRRSVEARLREAQTRRVARGGPGTEPAAGASTGSGTGTGQSEGPAPRVVGHAAPPASTLMVPQWGQPLGAQDRQRVREVLARILEERRQRRADRPLPPGRDGGQAW